MSEAGAAVEAQQRSRLGIVAHGAVPDLATGNLEVTLFDFHTALRWWPWRPLCPLPSVIDRAPGIDKGLTWLKLRTGADRRVTVPAGSRRARGQSQQGARRRRETRRDARPVLRADARPDHQGPAGPGDDRGIA